MFNAEKFLIDYDIKHFTEGKNVQEGWVNIKCPFCGDKSNHGGFNPIEAYYNCWRCDWHSLQEIITTITEITYSEVNRIIKQYSKFSSIAKKKKAEVKQGKLLLPESTEELKKNHKKYLMKRNFDPDKLEKEFGLKGTGNYGGYKYRIIAPIYYDERLVSYQGRDVTNRQELRYKACSKLEELIFHKYILYNIDNARGETAIAVEGITDVWRLGAGSVATFGTGFTLAQVNLLTNRFKRLFILYDTNAEKQAEKIGLYSSVKCEVELIDIEADDPAQLSNSDATYLMKYLKVNK